MKAEVEKAIAEIKMAFQGLLCEVFPSPCGGAHVLLHEVPLGPPYVQVTTWVAFFISNACPYADVYPFWIRSDLERIDKQEIVAPIHTSNQNWAPDLPNFPARKAVMISRRQNQANSIGRETPLLKLLTVLKWLKSR